MEEEAPPSPVVPIEEPVEPSPPRRKNLPIPPPINTSPTSPRMPSGNNGRNSPRIAASPRARQQRPLSPSDRPASQRNIREKLFSPRARRSESPHDPRMSLFRSSTEGAFTMQRRIEQSAPTTPRINSPRANAYRRSMPIFKVPEITEEINNYKELALKNKLPLNLTQGTYDDIIYALASDRKTLASQHKFEKSDKLNDAISYVKECQLQAAKNDLVRKEQEANQEKNQEILKELEKFDADSKRLLGELLANEKKLRADLEQQHEKEITDNENLWTSDAKIKLYNAPTTSLTTLKKQINQLTLQCRFKEASVVTKEYQKQKAREEKESFALMQHDYDECLTKILDRHKEELQAFDAQTDIRVKHFEVTRGKERKQIENKLFINKNAAETIQDPEKLWAKTNIQRQQKNDGPLNASTKITKKDILDPDFELLTLPPLDLKRPKK